MDDLPAGAMSAKRRGPHLSVVIPVKNGEHDLGCCLRRLRSSTWTDFEVIVVDDGSTDQSGELASVMGARVIRLEPTRGPALARNEGVKHALAPWIFFLDADVAVHPETLEKAVRHLESHVEVVALFGSYDAQPSARGLVSQYRNLLHHHVHQTGEFDSDNLRPARSFWTGCGIVRRDIFDLLGGFDPELYPRPAIEDIEFGYRLANAGYKCVLARDVLATHLKTWTLFHMIQTDILRRGVPWMILQWRSHVAENDLNVAKDQKVCVAAVGFGLLAVILAVAFSPWWLLVTLGSLATVARINRRFYSFLTKAKGLRFALAALPLHALYYICCGCSVVIAAFVWRATRLETAFGPPGASGPHRVARRNSQHHVPWKF